MASGQDPRVTEEGADDQMMYVVDETVDKQATPPGMLSRNRLTQSGGPGKEAAEEQGTNKLILGAAVVGLLVIGLGIAAVFASNVELKQIEAEAEAAAAAKPELPEDVQGVQVRKGMKHNPMAPPKKPGETIADEEPMPLNAVPDGGPPPAGSPEDAAAPEGEAAPEGAPPE